MAPAVGGRVLMRTRLFAVGVSLICFALIGGAAQADSVTVPNFSFETVNPMVGLPDSCGTGCAFNSASSADPIPDWTTSGTGGQFEPGSILTPPDGSLVAYLNGASSMSQTLSASVSPDTTYTLTVDVANRPGFTDNFTINLMDGSTVLSSCPGSTASIPLGTFAAETCTYASNGAPPLGDITILITGSDGIPGVTGQVDFDDVTLTDVPVNTPEPASVAMLAVGLLFLTLIGGLYKRKQDTSNAA
jgi:hypothetical protein